MTYENVEYQREDALAIIRLNRPDAYNALNVPLMRDFFQAVTEADVDTGVRAVLIAANGPAYSGGGDVKAFVQAGDGMSRLIHELTMYLHSSVSRLVRMQKPVVNAINGMAAGAGFAMSMIGDIALAGEGAKFSSAYSRIGASPDGSSTFFLARIVGMRRALELVYTNRVLSAQEALEWELINRVVPDADLEKEARAVALELSRGPTLAYGRAKDLIYHSINHDLEAQMERETQYIVASSKTEDFRNATRAFVEKTTTEYKGR